MKLVIFPDIVMKYCQKDEDVQKIINTGTEKRFEFFCHQIVLDEISEWISSEISPELEEFKKHVEVHTKGLPEELMKKAKQKVSNEGQAFILAFADNLGINIIWSDKENIISQFQERNTTTTELLRELPKMKPRFIGSLGEDQPNLHQQSIWDNPPITLPPENIIAEEEKSAEMPWPDEETARKFMDILVPYMIEELKKSLKDPGLPLITYNYKNEPEIDYITYENLPNFKMAREIRTLHYCGSNQCEEDGEETFYYHLNLWEYKRRENHKWLEPWEQVTTETPYLYFNIIPFFVDKYGDIVGNYDKEFLPIKIFPEKKIRSSDSTQESVGFTSKKLVSNSKYPFAENKYFHLHDLLPQEAIVESEWEEKFSKIDLNELKRYFGLRKSSLCRRARYLQVRFDPNKFPENHEYIFYIGDLRDELEEKCAAKRHDLLEFFGLE